MGSSINRLGGVGSKFARGVPGDNAGRAQAVRCHGPTASWTHLPVRRVRSHVQTSVPRAGLVPTRSARRSLAPKGLDVRTDRTARSRRSHLNVWASSRPAIGTPMRGRRAIADGETKRVRRRRAERPSLPDGARRAPRRRWYAVLGAKWFATGQRTRGASPDGCERRGGRWRLERPGRLMSRSADRRLADVAARRATKAEALPARPRCSGGPSAMWRVG